MRYIAVVCVFSEEFIALAILRLVEMEKAIVEGAGAIGLAAVLGDYVPELKGKRYTGLGLHSYEVVVGYLMYSHVISTVMSP